MTSIHFNSTFSSFCRPRTSWCTRESHRLKRISSRLLPPLVRKIEIDVAARGARVYCRRESRTYNREQDTYPLRAYRSLFSPIFLTLLSLDYRSIDLFSLSREDTHRLLAPVSLFSPGLVPSHNIPFTQFILRFVLLLTFFFPTFHLPLFRQSTNYKAARIAALLCTHINTFLTWARNETCSVHSYSFDIRTSTHVHVHVCTYIRLSTLPFLCFLSRTRATLVFYPSEI